jgi:hypothetical protein
MVVDVVSIDVVLQPTQSSQPYTLMVSTFKPGQVGLSLSLSLSLSLCVCVCHSGLAWLTSSCQECEFVLTLWTDVPVDVKPIAADVAAA